MTRTLVFVTLISTLALNACGPAPSSTGSTAGKEPSASPAVVTVYSGRNESLVGPLLERYEEATGVDVEVRYADTSELTATLLEEGDRTPADLFISQDAAALGALSHAHLLRPLPEAVLAAVKEDYAAETGDWVGLSGRARSVVYNTELITPAELPQRLADVTDPKYKGTFGVAPANGSFQAHMAVYGVVHGAEGLAHLLEGIAANEPKTYPKNSAIVEAVLAGEVQWGLVNHYYLWRALREQPDAPGANHFLPGNDASGFVNIAGAALLSDNEAALELLEFLLDEEAQTYFATETYEYPLAAGVEPAVDLPPLAEIGTPDVDFGAVSNQLEPTLVAIRASGLLP